jgi:hypothetical protein
MKDVQKGQPEDEKIKKIKEEKSPGFMKKNGQVVLWYKGRVCVPNIKELKDKIF